MKGPNVSIFASQWNMGLCVFLSCVGSENAKDFALTILQVPFV